MDSCTSFPSHVRLITMMMMMIIDSEIIVDEIV